MTKETKMAADAGAAATADVLAAFEAYKQANDERLAEIEAKGTHDPLLDAKLKKLDRRLDEISLKAARPEEASPARSGWFSSHSRE